MKILKKNMIPIASNNEAIETETKSNLTTNEPNCKFGNLVLKRGEQMVTGTKWFSHTRYTECKCNIPPFISCIEFIRH